MKNKRNTLALTAAWTLFSLSTQPAAAVQLGVQSKSFTVGKGGTLEVDTTGGDIGIDSWEKEEVEVKAEGISQETLSDLKMEQVGKTVRVQYHPPGHRSSRARFEITVPSRFNLNLRTAGGDIHLKNPIAGSVRGSTSGGDIRIADINGEVSMHTSGGDITAGEVEGNVILKTSGGDIRVSSASGTVEVATSGGDIVVGAVGKVLKASTSGGDVKIANVGGEATVRTAGGDITTGDVGGKIEASTAGGDIRAGKITGSASLTTAGGDIFLRGASGLAKTSTAGGDIHLKDISGSIEASTAGGDIVAELAPAGTGTSKLTSAGGDIRLYLPESARARVEARIRLQGRRARDEYDIRSDFKAETYQRDEENNEIRGVYILNGGGAAIRLETTNAHIEIRRLASRPQ